MSNTNNPAGPNPGNPGTPGNPGNPGTPGTPGFDSGFITGEFRHEQLSARVPEAVARGVFSTGVVVLTTQTEFILDFLVRMARPHQIAARVVLPPVVIPSIVAVLRDNIQKYTHSFGPIPPLPVPDPSQRPTLQEVYDDLKMPDEALSGTYANGLMVGHTPAEFCFDFITNFYPRSAVSARVYLSAPHVPRLVDSLSQTFNDFQRRIAAAAAAARPATPPTAPPGSLPPAAPGPQGTPPTSS